MLTKSWRLISARRVAARDQLPREIHGTLETVLPGNRAGKRAGEGGVDKMHCPPGECVLAKHLVT